MTDFAERQLTQDEIDFTYKGYVNQMSNKDKRDEFVSNFNLYDIDIYTNENINLMATLLTNNTTVECQNGIMIYSCDWVKSKQQYEQAKGNN